MIDTVQSCLNWFRKALPTPLSKNIHTQIGVHFEEVVEMLMEIDGLDEETDILLANAKIAMHQLAVHLKYKDGVIVICHAARQNMLDALCDQLVTNIGTAHCLSMEIDGAFNEVNESNWSKFVDGEPVFDENRKIAKGPKYRKPDLARFV